MTDKITGNPKIKSGKIKSVVTFLITWQFIILALWQYRSVKKSREALLTIKKLKNDFLGDMSFSRIIFTDRKFYFNLHVPGFPSKIMLKNQLGELNRVRPVRSPANRLRVLILGITNKCPLQCKHCYEWDNLNKIVQMGIEEYKAIVTKFMDEGVGQVHLGGGEPMMNYSCLLDLTKFMKGKTEIWIATSGLGLSLAKAKELKKSGLTGAAISVDHYLEEYHNDFRGSTKSFEWAMDATRNSLEAGLVTCWSICPTREFISKENLYTYANFAASKGVQFIQVFEPMPAGRYKGQDVSLTAEHLELLDNFYLEYNEDKTLKDKPLITYHGYHQRRLGCLGNGNRYLYIDARGNLHPCPFCRNDHPLNVLDNPVGTLLLNLSREECQLDGRQEKAPVENPPGL
jgi:MoaA/NifB/PqqE/SkfB family radical SAM enzyme